MDIEDLRNLSTGMSIANAAFSLAGKVRGRKPSLRVRVRPSHSAHGAFAFTALVSEVGNQVPALDVRIFAEISGVDDWRHESAPFHLKAGELDRGIPFNVPRPKYVTRVKACNNQTTLYGRTLEVTAVSEDDGVAVDQWREEEYDPETNRARFDVMQAVWAAGLAGPEHEDPGAAV